MASKTEAMAEGLGKGETKIGKTGSKVHSMIVHRAHGGHVVHHYHKPYRDGAGMEPDATHIVPHGHPEDGSGPDHGHLDALHAHMEDHMGAPNAGESELAEGVIPGAAPAGAAPSAPANMNPAA